MAEILEGVHYVDGSNANSYLVKQSDGTLTLIDAGMQSNGRKILGYITMKMSRTPSDVRTIVLTHCHVDHVRGAAALKAATGARVVVHEGDADFVSGKARYPSPGGAMGFVFGAMSPFFRTTPVEPDQRLKEGDRIGRFAVIHTPGHTPGSIALYDEENKVLFVGDTVQFRNGKLEGSPPRFTQDRARAKASVERLSSLDFHFLLSGHGEPLKSADGPRMLKGLSETL